MIYKTLKREVKNKQPPLKTLKKILKIKIEQNAPH